eukprot:12111083-Ditylum_brightwellii.AAC.1
MQKGMTQAITNSVITSANVIIAANFKAHLGNSERERAKGARSPLKAALGIDSIKHSSAVDADGK